MSPEKRSVSEQSRLAYPADNLQGAATSVKWVIGLFVAYLVLVLVAYMPTFGASFQADDFVLVATIAKKGPFSIWTYHSNFLRPLVSLSLYLDDRLWGEHALGFHLTNIVAHTVNGLLICAATWLLLAKQGIAEARRKFVASLAGGLFLALPSHVEAVAWVAGRADVVATLFALASLVAYLLYRLRGHLSLLIGSLGLWSLALISKESAIIWPLILLAYEWICGGEKLRQNRSALRMLALYGGLFVGYFLIRRVMLGTLVGGYESQFQNIGPAYIARSVLMQLIFSCAPYLPLPAWWGIASVLFLMALAGAAIWKRLWIPPIRFLWVAFLLALLPVLLFAIAPYGQNSRFCYLPSAFAVMALAMTIGQLSTQASVRLAAVGLVALFCGQTYVTSRIWREASQLCAGIVSTLANSRDSSITILTLPVTYHGAYLFGMQGRFGAMESLNAALSLRKEHPPTLHLVALIGMTGPEDVLDARPQHGMWTLRLNHAGVRPTFLRPYVGLDATCIEAIDVTRGTAFGVRRANDLAPEQEDSIASVFRTPSLSARASRWTKSQIVYVDSLSIRLTKAARQSTLFVYRPNGLVMLGGQSKRAVGQYTFH